jgi:dTDP-glucose pyrophosphorylase
MNIKTDWHKATLTDKASIKDAIENLIASSLQIIVIIDSNGLLIGVVNDGDIRRGVLRGLKLTDSIKEILNRNPLVVNEDVSLDSVIKLMNDNHFIAVPIVDKNRYVIGLHLISEINLPIEKHNSVIIMAGGKGQRLLPKTKDCPKPLLPINGKPMLEHIILKAKAEGFSHFVIALHYLGDMIKEYFGDGSAWNVEINYLNEEEPLGTAGAISLLKDKPKLPVIVTNADIVSDITYSRLLDFHNQHKSAYATMGVRLYESTHPFGVVKTDGVDIVGFEEKPILRSNVNAGIYVLDPKALSCLKLNEYCDMPTLFNRIQQKKLRTIVYPIHESWTDIGHLREYTNANST